MNIGPGFGAVGPTRTYYPLSDFGKWYLSLNMLIGRLKYVLSIGIVLSIILARLTKIAPVQRAVIR